MQSNQGQQKLLLVVEPLPGCLESCEQCAWMLNFDVFHLICQPRVEIYWNQSSGVLCWTNSQWYQEKEFEQVVAIDRESLSKADIASVFSVSTSFLIVIIMYHNICYMSSTPTGPTPLADLANWDPARCWNLQASSLERRFRDLSWQT